MMDEVHARLQHPQLDKHGNPIIFKPLPPGGHWQLFKYLDIYTKIDDEFRVQTSTGAILSLIGWVVIALLVLGECRSYMTVQTTEHMLVDASLGQQLRINVNISFHNLPCSKVHLDTMDIAGDNHLNIEQNMSEQALSRRGFPVGDVIVTPTMKVEIPLNYCGPCYDAETTVVRCCNTCADLKRAYVNKGLQFSDQVYKTAPQCAKERVHRLASQFEGIQTFNADDENAPVGCRVVGTMKVNKVGGNFHIAHGDSIVRDGRHIHQFNPADAAGFDVSHTIHSVSFGDPYPNMPPNPLDGVSKTKLPETGLCQYFIKVIPTVHTSAFGYKHLTNQYTFTERFRPFSKPQFSPSGELLVTQGLVLPGIFFVYEISPFMVEVREKSMPFHRLFSRLCAIVGGVFTLCGVLDALFYRLSKPSRAT